MTYDSIRPGQPWFDTSGQRIQAHGGSIIVVDGTFYWYGEDKSRTRPGSGVWHDGVRCYASDDLYNWDDQGTIIPASDDPASPLHSSRLVDRPHIIFNARTRTFVCWLKIMESEFQESTVLVSDSLLGPYEIVATGLRPLGMSAGDFDLVVDPVDGKAYSFFERVHSEMICADLDADYTGVTGYYSTHFPQPQPPDVREAPAYFRRGRRHYLFTSGTTGYFPNRSQVAHASTYHGPWTVLGDPHPGDPTGTSYRSQICSVFRHPAKRDLFIALADRWLPRLEPGVVDAEAVFRDVFSGDPEREAAARARVPEEWWDPDTSIADYVWLPVRFDGEMVVLDWHDEWRIEDHD